MDEMLDVDISPELEVLLVDVASEMVAIPINSVKEVIEYTKITKVPMCHEQLSGVINIRGSVVPVVDAALRLDLDSNQSYDKYSCIILYESRNEKLQEDVTIGIVVSRVRSIKSIALHDIYDKPAFGVHIPSQYVAEMIEVGGDTVPLLEMPALLNGEALNGLMLQHQRSLLSRWES